MAKKRTASTPRRPSARDAWLLPYLELQTKYDVRVEALLREAAAESERLARDIADKPGIGAATRRAQLLGVRSPLFRSIATVLFAVGDTVRGGRAEAAALATEAGLDWDGTLLSRAIPDAAKRDVIRANLIQASQRGVEVFIARQFSDRRPLSVQVYKTIQVANGYLDRQIGFAIARGASAREIGQIARDSIRPSTPGGVAYAAKRLARSEINAAYHAVAIRDSQNKPWISQMKWNLSKSHGAKDECDIYARRGAYPVDAVPDKPHPQCLCFTTPILPTAAMFVSALNSGEYDQWIRANEAAA